MPLLPLSLPPGFFRNGTALQAAGRWRDGSLVRWRDGVLQPIKGWAKRAQLPGTSPARDALSWTDNGGDSWLVAGTANALYSMSKSNLVSTITPVGLTVGRDSAESNTGFGGGFFGLTAFGVPRPETGTMIEATTWSLDTWGQNLIACSSEDQGIYEWVPGAAAALPLANAPTARAILSTEERFIFALGAAGNPRRVAWCDREKNTVWTASATNQAGGYELQTGGSIMLGLQTRGQSLILTDEDAHVGNYVGGDFVYGFERVGTSCGAISRKAAAVVDQGAFWMGEGGFYRFSGGVVEPLDCEVGDFVFRDLNLLQASKVSAVSNARYGEVWWFYPSGGSTENDRYVAYNYAEGHWLIGSIARTAGVDAGAFRHPVWIDPKGAIYSHETGLAHGTAVPYCETGPVQLGVGDNVYDVVGMMPDENTQGDVRATFKTRFHPNGPERSYGPFAMAAPTSMRFAGRQVVMRLDAARKADWRVGVNRLDVRAGGLR